MIGCARFETISVRPRAPVEWISICVMLDVITAPLTVARHDDHWLLNDTSDTPRLESPPCVLAVSSELGGCALMPLSDAMTELGSDSATPGASWICDWFCCETSELQ